ncbi:6047_t:CDS:2, partial [Dentiscutata heterogama]
MYQSLQKLAHDFFFSTPLNPKLLHIVGPHPISPILVLFNFSTPIIDNSIKIKNVNSSFNYSQNLLSNVINNNRVKAFPNNYANSNFSSLINNSNHIFKLDSVPSKIPNCENFSLLISNYSNTSN